MFEADSRLDASFDLTGVPNAAPQGAEFDWSRAELQSESIIGLDSTALGVSFVEVADPYQSVNISRSTGH